jgi:hypothetical protein
MHAVVAMYESLGGASIAFHALREAGLDTRQLTIVGQKPSSHRQLRWFHVAGVPASRIATHENDVKSGKFLLLAGGTADMIGLACALLGKTGPSRLTAYAAGACSGTVESGAPAGRSATEGPSGSMSVEQSASAT